MRICGILANQKEIVGLWNIVEDVHSQVKTQGYFPLTPMGALHTGLRTQDPPLSPPIGANVCRVAYKYLPQPIKSHIQSFRTLGNSSGPLVCPCMPYLGGGVGGFLKEREKRKKRH